MEFDENGVFVFSCPRSIGELKIESHNHLIRCPSLAHAKELWAVLSKLSELGFVANTTSIFQCTDGICIGLRKENGERTLKDVIKNCPEQFFDTFERKYLTNMKVEKFKVQPSAFYIRLLKAIIVVLEALEKSSFSVSLSMDSIILIEHQVRFIGFILSKTKDDVIGDFLDLIDKVNDGVGEKRGLMKSFKEELKSRDYKTLLNDPTLKLPREKIQFMMELGGFLESKSLQDDLRRTRKHYLVFENFESLSKEDYYLSWLVYANQLTGFKKLTHSSYFEPEKDCRREDKTTSWVKDKERSTRPQGSAMEPKEKWKQKFEAKKNATLGSVSRKSTGVVDIIYITKLFRHSYAHNSNLILVFKEALGFESQEDLQLIVEMLFPDHIRELTYLYRELKHLHASQSEIASWDGSSKQNPVQRPIAENRPNTWSERILQKEIEDLRRKGLGNEKECLNKKEELAHKMQALNDSLHYGLK